MALDPLTPIRSTFVVRPKLLAGVLLAAFLLSAVFQAFTKDIASGFDEVAHVSFVAQIQTCACIPPLTGLQLVDPATMQFTSEANYLNHPSSYYGLLALGPDITGALPAYRLLNAAMIAAALLLMFGTVFTAVREDHYRIVGVVLVGSVPVLAQLGASVSNDNLAILGGALVSYGAARYLISFSFSSLRLICAGLLLAALAKLTGLILCGTFIVLLLVQLRPPARHVAVVAFALSISVLPYVALWLTYGSPAPETPGQLQMLTDGARNSGWDQRARLSPMK